MKVKMGFFNVWNRWRGTCAIPIYQVLPCLVISTGVCIQGRWDILLLLAVMSTSGPVEVHCPVIGYGDGSCCTAVCAGSL